MTKLAYKDWFHFNGYALPAAFTSTLVGGASVAMNNGQVDLALAATSEVESARLSMGDMLPYWIGNLIGVTFWAKVSASLAAQVSVAMGMCAAGNANPLGVAGHMFFTLNGNNNVAVHTSDGTLVNNNIAANDVLTNSWKKFAINLAEGTVTVGPPANNIGGQGGQRDVLFGFENSDFNQSVLRRVATRTLFDLGNYGGNLQPYFQIQKTNSAATGTLSIRRMEVEYRL